MNTGCDRLLLIFAQVGAYRSAIQVSLRKVPKIAAGANGNVTSIHRVINAHSVRSGKAGNGRGRILNDIA